MSRWVDADALIKEMSEKHRPNFHEDLKSYHMWIMWYWALKEAPHIDIVRCKECKYKDMELCAMYKLVVAGVRKYDDFCSYGERKDDGKDIQSATE